MVTREKLQTNKPGYTVELETGGWTDKYRLLHDGKRTEWGSYEDALQLGDMAAVSPYYTDADTWQVMTVCEAAAILFVQADGSDDPPIML